MYDLLFDAAPEKIFSVSATGMLQEMKSSSLKNQESIVVDQKKEEIIRHMHMKNRKKFMHLYELEKHFR